jgi:hypothetical protein
MATITPIQVSVTKVAAFNGASLDISALTGDWTICFEVQTVLGSDTSLRFTFQDSVDAFTTTVAGPSFSVYGPSAKTNSRKFSLKKQDFPDLRFGIASAVLRLALTRVTGGSASVTYQAWLES